MPEGTKLILLVDDDPDIARFIAWILRREGFEMGFATNGLEGTERTRELRPDLVISSVMMSQLNGFELTRDIRSDPQVGETPILILSARDRDVDKLEGLVAGADDYMTKPFEPEELVRHVRALFERMGHPSYRRPLEGEVSATEQDALAHLERLAERSTGKLTG